MIGAGLLGGVGELTGLVWRPRPVEPVPVVSGDAPARPLRRGEPFTVLCWNVQYGAGRRRHFFYDGGDAVHADPGQVAETLAGLRDVVATADVALLQELDRDSDRTGRVDELMPLIPGFTSWATTPYHRSRFVPHPPRHPLGRMDLHLALLSRAPLSDARRLALPLLREPRLRRAFNLKRAVLDARVAVEGDAGLDVAVTHLSAFSRGDGTLPAQVAVLAAWMDERRAAGRSFVLGGDLNLLPPGDDPARLPDPEEYPDRPPPIEALIPRFRSVIAPARLLDPSVRTYQPFASAPDRVLDYLFVSDDVEVLEVGVLPSDLSDHLPLRAVLRLAPR